MKITKTVVIWDECGEQPIKFCILEGDQRKFNNIYINRYSEDAKIIELETELLSIMYNEDGEKLSSMLDHFPNLQDQCAVIVCGFLP